MVLAANPAPIAPARAGCGLEMIEKRYVGTPLDGDRRKAFGCRNHTGARGHFGILPGLTFERQADGDLANVPIRSVEHFHLQTFILN